MKPLPSSILGEIVVGGNRTLIALLSKSYDILINMQDAASSPQERDAIQLALGAAQEGEDILRKILRTSGEGQVGRVKLGRVLRSWMDQVDLHELASLYTEMGEYLSDPESHLEGPGGTAKRAYLQRLLMVAGRKLERAALGESAASAYQHLSEATTSGMIATRTEGSGEETSYVFKDQTMAAEFARAAGRVGSAKVDKMPTPYKGGWIVFLTRVSMSDIPYYDDIADRYDGKHPE